MPSRTCGRIFVAGTSERLSDVAGGWEKVALTLDTRVGPARTKSLLTGCRSRDGRAVDSHSIPLRITLFQNSTDTGYLAEMFMTPLYSSVFEITVLTILSSLFAKYLLMSPKV